MWQEAGPPGAWPLTTTTELSGCRGYLHFTSPTQPLARSHARDAQGGHLCLHH